MTRHERVQFFEAILRLREQYASRGEQDRVGSHRIDRVVRWAERELRAASLEASAAGPGDAPAR